PRGHGRRRDGRHLRQPRDARRHRPGARRMAGVTGDPSPPPPLSRAAIVAVGSELLTPTKVDTNSLFITEQLNALGIDVIIKAVVGDDRDELIGVFNA